MILWGPAPTWRIMPYEREGRYLLLKGGRQNEDPLLNWRKVLLLELQAPLFFADAGMCGGYPPSPGATVAASAMAKRIWPSATSTSPT